MPRYTGSCSCQQVKYEINLDSPEDSRTSLCHCRSCKKTYGANYGLTCKVPVDKFRYTAGQTKDYAADNGGGTDVHREFCPNCGSFILDYGEAAKEKFRFICVGSLDDENADIARPVGEFFCKYKASWMPDIPDVFRKQEIKE